MSKRLLTLVTLLMMALAAGCAEGAGGAPEQKNSVKTPMTTAAAALDEVVGKVEAGNAAGGREAYQAFANAFGQVLGPVSFKDTAVATQIANANTALQEALAQQKIDGTAVRRQAEALRLGLFAAADVMGVSLRATAAAQLGMAPPRVIEVTALEYEFSPRVIDLQKGEQVTIRLINAGTEKHEWEAEALHAEVKPVEPGKTGEVTFTAPNAPGIYEFACFLDGHHEKGMKGFVRVR